MSSEGRLETRRAILAACWKLLDEKGVPSLEQIAQAAGVSRQAVYLHFKSRNELLIECIEYIKTECGVPALLDNLHRAPDADGVLDAMLAFHLEFTPRTARGSLLVELERARDPDLEDAWQKRSGNRLQLFRVVVDRFAAENRLVDGWSRDDAADFLWALMSPSITFDLLTRRRWSKKRLHDRLHHTITATLLTPRKSK
jgi:AcrR family transcriptional regulator